MSARGIQHTPIGMMGRITLVLAGAILLELLGALALHRWQDRELVDASRTLLIAQQLVNAIHIAEAAPPAQRARLMHGLTLEELALNWVPSTVITDHSATEARLATMRARLVQVAPELGRREMRLNLMPGTNGRQHDLVGLMALDDGSFISFRVNRYLRVPPPLWLVFVLHILLLVIVFGLALLMVRTLIQPLRDLAIAADETGRNHARAIIPAGPREVRLLARAFSAMQARLLKVMEDNTQALITVSHDLRTPIQRAKLRASMLDDVEAGDAIGQDLVVMENFIHGALAYVRSGTDEQPRLIDVATVLCTIVDDTADQGVGICYHGPVSFIMHTRPTVLTRMVQNLVDNARRHATRIEVGLSGAEGQLAEIRVDDDGPGILPEKRAEAIQPFRKLGTVQQAGNSEENMKQGAGLGLAFIQRALLRQGGSLTLEESPLGGLRARVTIPDARSY